MNSIENIFRRKKVVISKLEPFGFKRTAAGYVFEKKLPDSNFEMTVTVAPDGSVETLVIDPNFNEPYSLHLTDATGAFVCSIKAEYEKLLKEISQECFEPDVFKSAQAKEIIAYVRDVYGNELEFLWEKSPDNAILRRDDSQKWYGALLTVQKSKLGLDSDEKVEIIDLREQPDRVKALVDGKKFFQGWHMNKKTWYTIILDGSVHTEEIYKKIDISFSLAYK